MSRRLPSAAPARRHRVRFLALVASGVALCALVCSPREASADELECAIDEGNISCDVDLGEFYSDEIREVLNNGWENAIHFRLVLRDEETAEVVAISFSSVSQRCYIDPFEDPCLALWSGAETWDSYDDVDAMIDDIGSFTLVSVPVEELGTGRYSAHLEAQLNPITDEQVSVIRSWLARHRGGHLVVGKNESSIFGTFVSVFANVRSGRAEAAVVIEGSPFDVP